ncbi:MAG: gamma-glutamylcyclotransferase [Bacteroidetes bacterium QH_9_64_21]|nr:MAG: gamma-glutamylcyclotransferase [Bacteroidetes bacterium QH_9_64_21]
MLYFAYGSNMLTERLRNRVPSAEPITAASLPDRALRFHKRSIDGSGKCNLVDGDEDSEVCGVLLRVNPDERTALDEAEHRGRGYERCRVPPETDDQTSEAFAYVAQPAYIDDALLPSDWYKALVMAGAHQHSLPQSYWAYLDSVRTYPDPDGSRRASHQSLVRTAGYQHLWPAS